jgi:hypothetical protein
MLAFRFTGSVPVDAVDPRRLASPWEATLPQITSSISASAQSMASICALNFLASPSVGPFPLDDAGVDVDGFIVYYKSGDCFVK